MTIADIKKTAEQKMARSVESFKNELQKIRTGRAHPGILDQVHVDYYGSMVPISQVANVTLMDARTISVQPWEKGMGAKIEKAIRESDLGLNPSAQGDLLRVPMPALTEERRKDLTKVVRHAAEDARIAVRNLRRDANDHAKKLLKIRTGRAHPGILDQVHIDYYGSMVPISQVANVTLLDARTISVQPWEKGMGAKIEKAIRESDLGLNPAAQGDLLRVPMPPLTEERRRELVKVVRNASEDSKIAVRNLRRDANDHAKKLLKDKQVSEDEERRSLEEMQRTTDRMIAEIDRLTSAKEAEIMAV